MLKFASMQQSIYNTCLFVTSLGLSVAVQAQNWQSIGPGPLFDGQIEGITDRPVIGAIHGIAPHPTDANILYLATVNGGVWKSVDATAASPTWIPLTDDQESLSMGDIEFDVTDSSFNTLVAGFGRFSSLGSRGGSRSGVLRTTDGGDNWTLIDGGIAGRNIASIEARGAVMLAAVNSADSFTCNNIGLFRSTDLGLSWSQLTDNEGMTRGAATALTADPDNPAVFYAGIHNFNQACSTVPSGIYKTTDTGASWSKISDLAMDGIISNNSCHFEIAVGASNNLFVAMVCIGGTLDGVFHSADGGSSWTSMDIPVTSDGVGIHPGGQGRLHSSIAIDPTNNNIVYVGGDRQNSPFPNPIGARDFSGRIFRGDVSQPSGSQWAPLTHAGTASNSSTHADSRDMQFNALGHLIEADDGGLYRHTTPRSADGDWASINGNLAITEQHDSAYDNNSNVVVSGNQDNGTSVQQFFADTTWSNFFNADGGDVVVDTLSRAGFNESVRFYSFQNLGALRRVIYDQNNDIVSIAAPALAPIFPSAAVDPQFVTPLAINQVNGNRLIIGAENSVYESLDQGDTVTEIGPGIEVIGVGRINIGYGAVGNEDVLYVGACQGDCSDGNDGIFVRTSALGALNLTYTQTSGSTIQSIAVNPNNPAEAFAVEDFIVLHTLNSGGNWTDITGSLTGFGQIRSLAFMPDGVDSGLAVGTNRGVYLSRQSGAYSNWAELAMNLPNVPVFDLQYDQGGDRLIAGTLGRGSFAITGILSGNSSPELMADVIEVTKGGTITVLADGSTSLLDNDSDPDVGDLLTVETTATIGPVNGTVTLFADGTFSFEHDDSNATSDEFFYRVCDDGTPMFCPDAKVTIKVVPEDLIFANGFEEVL